MHGQSGVDGGNRNGLEPAPMPAFPCIPRQGPANLILGKGQDEKDEKEKQGNDEGNFPVGEPLYGNVLDFTSVSQRATIYGRKSQGAD